MAVLEENGIVPDVVEYLKKPLSAQEISAVARKLGMTVREMTRTGEDAYLNQKLDGASDEELAAAIAKTPILMQRPIVVCGDKAKIGRPPEGVLEILA